MEGNVGWVRMGPRVGAAPQLRKVGRRPPAFGQKIMGPRATAPGQPGDPVFGYRPNQAAVWFHRKRHLSNKYCLYCGQDVSDESLESKKEHLVARKFVPTGTLDGTAFNLVFRSCKPCNDRKGNLERHVSTITLLLSPARAESAEIDQLAMRKAKKDFHPHKKGVAVENAHETLQIPLSLGPMMGSVGMVAPPQLDQGSAVELATRHVQGIFSLITSTNPRTREGTRLLPARDILCEQICHARDWGNPRLIQLAQRIQGWKQLAVITTAQGFFQAEFRRDEGGTGQWFWALEWNKSTRAVGIIKNPGESSPLLDDLPELTWKRLPNGQRYRLEQPLAADHQDLLFRQS